MRHQEDRPACRRRAPLVLIVLLGGCAWLPWGGEKDPGVAVGWKMVMEKLPPTYLLAVDRSECVVTNERWKEIDKGDEVFCAWRNDRLAGSRTRLREGDGETAIPGREPTVRPPPGTQPPPPNR